MSDEQDRPWTFSLVRGFLAIAFLGVALACWRVLASLYASEANAISAAILLVAMFSAASAAIGAIAGTAWKWAVVGFMVALPLAFILAVLFRAADV